MNKDKIVLMNACYLAKLTRMEQSKMVDRAMCDDPNIFRDYVFEKIEERQEYLRRKRAEI